MSDKRIPARTVFLSSTTKDLAQYRDVAQEVIAKLSVAFNGRYALVASSMKTETQDGERNPPVVDSRRWVREADWFVLIVAWNYGSICDGETISVTEWEYREATRECKPPKKCFVFLSAEKDKNGIGVEYRALGEAYEKENLIKFKTEEFQDRDHLEQVKRFRSELRENKTFEQFTNIDDFRVKLEATLRNKISKDLDALGPGGIWDILVVTGLLTPIRDCIEQVKLLTTLKRLHDRLHKIRQFGIRRWREEVLVRWCDESEFPLPAQQIYMSGLANVRDVVGEIRGLFLQLPEPLRLVLNSIDKVVAQKFPSVEEIKPLDRIRFKSEVDTFASRLQSAFTACNWQLQSGAVELHRRQGRLIQSGERAVTSPVLRNDERDVLADELGQTKGNEERLQAVLVQHEQWQRVHDQLEKIDDGIPANGFTGVRQIVLDCAEAVATLVAAAEDLARNQDHLRLWPSLIALVQADIIELQANPSENSYENMRKAFDNLFFRVDEETLRLVEYSEGRATVLEAGLRAKETEIADEIAKDRR